jgi:hypothetical protein
VGVVALAVPSLRRYDNRENQNKTGYTEITYDKPG